MTDELFTARAAVEAAFRELFPSAVQPISSDAIAWYSAFISRGAPAGFEQHMLSGHARTFESWPEVAGLFRSAEGFDDVASAAERLPHPHDARESVVEAQQRAGAAARARYGAALARQLLAAPSAFCPEDQRRKAAAYLEAIARVEHLELDIRARAAAERAATEQAERERRAAQDAAAAAQDAVEADRLLVDLLRAHGLPETLRSGTFVEANRERLVLLARVRRRLRSTRAETVRIGREVYEPKNLSTGLADAPAAQLAEIMASLERAEVSAS